MIALMIFGFFVLIAFICLTFWLLIWYFNFPITKEELKKEIKKIRN